MKTHDLSRAIRALVGSPQFVTYLSSTKTSDLSSALSDLASILSEGPNLLLQDIRTAKKYDETAVGLRALLSLSSYTKQQWLELVSDYELRIELNPRDSARDVLGKVLRYLDAHPETVRTLGTRKRKSKVDTSELENTLAKLLDRENG